jgi:hypothetical protein
VLAIQESKFPASISFTLIEPASRLIWKCSYEPTQEIITPSTFSVVDPGSFETFLTSIYDSFQPKSVIIPAKNPITMSGDWHNMSERDASNLASVELEDGVKIEMCKAQGKLRVYLSSVKELHDPMDYGGEVSQYVKELARSH